MMMRWIVTRTEAGLKLLPFLKTKLGNKHSVKALKRAIDANQCRINGKVESFSTHVVNHNDTIEVTLHAIQKPDLDHDRVLYEDDDLLVYNKPAGVNSDSPEILKRFPKSRLKLTHRLDRDTTGILIFAKNESALEKMEQQFKERLINKRYLAIVDGIPTHSSGIIENYLGPIHVYEGQKIWGKVPRTKGKLAITEWRVLKRGKQATLIECVPKTGRTHQIRVHLSSMEHPILGDFHYGTSFRNRYRPQRHLLHAESVTFIHPRSDKEMALSAPIPNDFLESLKKLGLA